MKRIIALMLLVMMLGTCVVHASPTIYYSGGSASSSVSLNVEPYDGDGGGSGITRRFSVTVPISLPLWVLSDNTTVAASTAQIVNNSTDDVRVTSVAINPHGDFKLVDFDSDFSLMDINSYKFGMVINDDMFNISTKKLNLTPSAWTIAKGKSLPIFYTARFAPITKSITDYDMAEVTFTVAFTD